MLGDYFYHQIFRKSILAFGTVFNNIIVKRKMPGVDVPTGKDSLEAFKVPIQYGPYQKYLAIIASEPNPERQRVQASLPRISFEIKGLNYDGSRKLAPTQFAKTQPAKGPDVKQPLQYKQYLPVPYNLDIEMAIIAKNQDDGLQIIEQILPAFQPSLNVSIEVIDVTHEERDIAIVLNGIGYTDDYEGDYTQRRTLIWTLNFTVKTYLFGPVQSQKDIRKVTIDYRTEFDAKRPTEVRYSAQPVSTLVPPTPRDEINPEKPETYKIVESYSDMFGDDQNYFGLD
jgi:hypothetical protein